MDEDRQEAMKNQFKSIGKMLGKGTAALFGFDQEDEYIAEQKIIDKNNNEAAWLPYAQRSKTIDDRKGEETRIKMEREKEDDKTASNIEKKTEAEKELQKLNMELLSHAKEVGLSAYDIMSGNSDAETVSKLEEIRKKKVEIYDLDKDISEELKKQHSEEYDYFGQLEDMMYEQQKTMHQRGYTPMLVKRQAEVGHQEDKLYRMERKHREIMGDVHSTQSEKNSSTIAIERQRMAVAKLKDTMFDGLGLGAKGDSMRSIGGGGHVAAQTMGVIGYQRQSAIYTKRCYEQLVILSGESDSRLDNNVTESHYRKTERNNATQVSF
jgi:hypothetical protein